MKTRIQKWGNSLAVRIPKSFAADAKIAENSEVSLTLSEGKLVIEPIQTEKLSLDSLLADVSDSNLHREWETGPALGREIW